jgi:CRP-like cAMP-binding protein
MDATKRVIFLRKNHLFRDLTDDQLMQIVERFTEQSFEPGKVIMEQGAQAESMHFIVSGRVRVHRRREGSEQELAVLVPGDYFGEMEILSPRGARSASITALEPTSTLVLPSKEFAEIVRAFPNIKPTLELTIASRKLARTVRFKWLRKEEVVYFLARKHSFFLLQVLIVPVLTLLIPAFLFLWGGFSGSVAAISFGAVALLVVLAWIGWNYLDWGNDYYVVTNQRVVWLEKVIGLYDSRSEAPLEQILSVSVESDLIGRSLSYGNVLVRTFVGAIPFRHVLHPHQAAHMVEEYWHRTQELSQQAEKEAFKDALRQRLGLLKPPEPKKEAPKEDRKFVFPRLYKPNIARLFFENLFKVRLEEGQTITYRKHLFVLLQQVFLPSVILLGLLGLLIVHLYTLATNPDLDLIQTLPDGSRALDTIAVSLPLLMIPVIFWWIYQYVDWKNDIFRVTGDQILDIDRKPFGTEERRAAPIDNILSTRYERIGFLGYILNFGTVYIDVGSAQFAFEDVLDPAAVQSDVDRRRLARISAKKDAERTSERNRMADWMAAYHQNVEDIRREQELKDAKSKSE